MSYLHCPVCRNAYNVATQPACPTCAPQQTALVGVTEQIVLAADQLARAIGRANPIQLAKARAELASRGLFKAIRAALPSPPPALAPVDPVVPRSGQALLATVALAMLTRLPRRLAAARAMLKN